MKREAGNSEDEDRVVQGLEAGRGHGDSAFGMIVWALGHTCTAGRAGWAQCWAVGGGPAPTDSWKPPGCVSRAPRLCWHALPDCGQIFSPHPLPLLPGWSCLWAQHLWASAEWVWGRLAPAVCSWPLLLYISFLLGLSFLPAHTKAVSGSLRINGISRSAARNNKNNHPIHNFGQCTANRLCV